MSDSEDRFDERAFDDPAHDEIRRLLADARVTDPIPDDVAARLDATLASLRERSREETASSSVVPLRRRIGPVLVAAAVLVVVGGGGVGIAQLAGSGSGGSADRAASGSVAADEDGSGSTTSGEAPQPAAPETVAGQAAKALPHLTTARFGQGVSRLMRTTYAAARDTRAPKATTPQSDAPQDLDNLAEGYLAPSAPPVTKAPLSALTGDYLDRAQTCAGPVAPDAVALPASLDGALVALVFRPPTSDAQVVEAWSCDGSSLLASTTVPH